MDGPFTLLDLFLGQFKESGDHNQGMRSLDTVPTPLKIWN